MTYITNTKAILAALLIGAALIGCTATDPQLGRDQLIQSITPGLIEIGVPTDGLETFQTIRLAELKAIVDKKPPEYFQRRSKAMLVIDAAQSEPAYGEGRADTFRFR